MPKLQQSLSVVFPRPVFLSPRFEGQSRKPWPSDHFPGSVFWKGWVILRVCSYKRSRLWWEGPGPLMCSSEHGLMPMYHGSFLVPWESSGEKVPGLMME